MLSPPPPKKKMMMTTTTTTTMMMTAAAAAVATTTTLFPADRQLPQALPPRHQRQLCWRSLRRSSVLAGSTVRNRVTDHSRQRGQSGKAVQLSRLT